MTSYCEYCEKLPKDDPNWAYHDNVYGFPVESDNELFGRLLLEINQAGLSWTTILKKEQGFRDAYSNFEIAKIAQYTHEDEQRLLGNVGIIRNKLKIYAAIHNAKQILALQYKYGSFKAWLDQIEATTIDEWVKEFKKEFKFVGGEIVKEFLLSTGYIKGAHVESCEVYNIILKKQPKWKEREEI